MPSKFDRLRAGEVVEIEPGRKGRLNAETKSFETSDGRTMYVGDDPDFYPQGEEGLKYSREKENLERQIKSTPAGEFLFQFGNQGIAGGAKNTVNKIIQKGDDYERTRRVQANVGQRISEESPWTSAGATAASFVPDIALTRGMSAVKAAPLITGLHAGPRIVEEPGEVATEALLSAAGGKLIDKGTGALNRIAQRRGQIRELPLQQQAVRDINAQNTSAFNALKQNVKSINESRLQQHQIDLSTRQNNMIQAQNKFDQAKSLRDAEVIRLKNQAEIAKAQRSSEASRLDAEYKAARASAEQETKRLNEEFKLAQSQYQEALKQLPDLQKKAQAEYGANVVKNAAEIEKNFPKNSRISSDDLGVKEFIDETIDKSGLAGSREGSQAKRILNSIFPEGEIVGGRQLSSRYKALEDAIQRSTPEVQGVLNNFKKHLGERLPVILEDSVAYTRIGPLLKRTIDNEVRSVMSEIEFLGKGSHLSKNMITKQLVNNANMAVKESLTPQNFIKKVQSGELAREIANKVATVEDFLIDIKPGDIPALKKSGMLQYISQEAERKHSYFVQELTQKLQNKLAKYEIKATQAARNASKKLGKDVKKTYGLAEPVNPPPAPVAPSPIQQPSLPGELPPVPPVQLPPPVQSPQIPPIPGKPSLLAEPPIPTAIAEPTLSPASGLSERAGDFLEQNLMGGKGLVNNPVAKLAGLKYLLGKGALPAEAAYLGAKTLTSPSAVGEAARITFKQGGIQAITQWAEKYPSFHDGILDNPRDRRSLTKEIEDASDIPIEQKAIIQSKINRGKPLEAKL